MPDHPNVKVFVSWSGDLAKGVAVALRDWLPVFFDRVDCWVSDVDIAAGQRGLAQIEAELASTQFGIVVVTQENQRAPWLNFEAGALSKTIQTHPEQRVVPLLVDLSSPSQLTGPLAQFQAKRADREGVRDLLLSLGVIAGVDNDVVLRRLEAHWGHLEEKIRVASEAIKGTAAAEEQPRDPQDILDEILQRVRRLDAASSQGTRPAMSTKGDFRAFALVAAGEHGLSLDSLEFKDGRAELWASPARGTEFSSEAFQAFETALNERFPGREITVNFVPF